MKAYRLVLSCEHASNRLPESYRYLFKGAEGDLNSHIGWDPGALELTMALAEKFSTDYTSYGYSRLLVEVNRSTWHPQLFSKYTKGLKDSVKTYLIDTYYRPYREKVEKKIRDVAEQGMPVVHVSVHTFTPDFFGEKREVEIGLLFDPERDPELRLCESWKAAMTDSSLDVRFNEPYRGTDDGFTTYLRTRFSPSVYLGIELEMSQKFSSEGSSIFETIGEGLVRALAPS